MLITSKHRGRWSITPIGFTTSGGNGSGVINNLPVSDRPSSADYNSIAVDSNDKVHIVFYRNDNSPLPRNKCIRLLGHFFGETNNNVGQRRHWRIDSNDGLHALTNTTLEALVAYAYDGSPVNWARTTVDGRWANSLLSLSILMTNLTYGSGAGGGGWTGAGSGGSGAGNGVQTAGDIDGTAIAIDSMAFTSPITIPATKTCRQWRVPASSSFRYASVDHIRLVGRHDGPGISSSLQGSTIIGTHTTTTGCSR